MRTMLKKAIRDESGKVLILALIVLVVGGLILGPLLGLMGTGLMAGQIYERKTSELYAADAGVEDAVWRLPQLHRQPDSLFPYSYPPHTHEPWLGGSDEFWVNDKSVTVVIDRTQIGETPCHRIFEYVINATATGDGRTTEIVALLTGTPVFHDHSRITDHILVAREGDLEDIKNKVTLYYAEENAPYPRWDGGWPTPSEIALFYWYDVKGDEVLHWYNDARIDTEGVSDEIGPLYVAGELDIRNSDNDAATLTLTGTLYITRDTSIGTHGKKNLTLDLDGHTIFVESASIGNGNEALKISDRVTIKGPGAIVAVGDVYFAPNGNVGDVGEPVFIMSVSGTTRIRPGITLYGAVAGHVDVTIQSGSKPTLTYPVEGFPEDLNFPGFLRDSESEPEYGITSWTIS